MKPLSAIFCAAAVLGGCAATDGTSPTSPSSKAADEYITGSRLSRRNGDNPQGVRVWAPGDLDRDDLNVKGDGIGHPQ